MKYTVTFSCGHEATVDLFGKTSERERRITWYEKEGICPDCYRKMKEDERRQADAELAAYADKIETEYNLPKLEGTEKQVSWARKIRAGVIRAWEAKHNIFYDEFITIRRGKVEEESNAYRYKIKHGATFRRGESRCAGGSRDQQHNATVQALVRNNVSGMDYRQPRLKKSAVHIP